MPNVMPDKKKRKLVDLSTKLAIIKYLDDGHSIRETADKFSLSKGTVQAAKQNGNLCYKKQKAIVRYPKPE